MTATAISQAPAPSPEWAQSPSAAFILPPPSTATSSQLSKLPFDFSRLLIAMVVIIATVIVTYSRLISRYFMNLHCRYRWWRRRLLRSNVTYMSPPYNASSLDPVDTFHVLSPYGLDESVIKTIPLSVYTQKSNVHECVVCLLEFEENDYVHMLPVCYHAFHVDCIDIRLGSHANCPLCRTRIFRPKSPFIPVMAARIRPSLEDMMIEGAILEPLPEAPPESDMNLGEITQEEVSPRSNPSEERFNGRDFLLKRSYSFGFERNLGSKRLVMEPATASLWRYRRGAGSFWSKRLSPFSSLMKPRVFSFRYYKGMKSLFSWRRGGFFPLSKSSA